MRRALGVLLVAAIATRAAAAPAPAAAHAWLVVALSADGTRVLERATGEPATRQHFRVVVIATQHVEAELDLPALSALPIESLADGGGVAGPQDPALDISAPCLADDLTRAAAALAAFPLGAAGRIAASPDGTHVAFNGGDWIFTANHGAIVTRVAAEPSYAPWFTPDGKTLMFRREHGLLDGVEGNYELYATAADGLQPPRELLGTAGVRDELALTDHDSVRVLVSAEPTIATCVVDVGLTAPFRVARLACLPDGERVVSCVLSPHGAFLGCVTVKRLAAADTGATTIFRGQQVATRAVAFRARTLEVATGKVVLDQRANGAPLAISDDGHLALDRNGTLVVLDARGTATTIRGDFGLAPRFRGATELVTDVGGTPVVLRVGKPTASGAR